MRYTLIMAKEPRKDESLGGFKFNQVGAPVRSQDSQNHDDGPIKITPRITPQSMRTCVIVVIVLLLACVVYVVSDYGLGGVEQHSGGRAISPTEKPTEPRTNF